MKTTHVRIYADSMKYLEELNGYTGEKSPGTLDRILKFALTERDRFLEKKQYENITRRFGGNKLYTPVCIKPAKVGISTKD